MTEFVSPGTRFTDLPSPFAMKRGEALHGARMAYETWGTLDAAKSNAILILTGLSPSAHAAANAGNPEPGWWEAMVGPGKAIDTDRWFVLCVNSLGSCKGSTGPASMDPATGAPYRLAFPDLSIEDCANAAHAVVRTLGIDTLACVIGNSMGGMVALAYLKLHPGASRAHVNVSGSARALPFSIAIRSLQREAIRLDPQWNHGDYDDAHYPVNGMRMARKLGVVTYRSAMEWDGRFGRVRLEGEHDDDGDPFGLEFEVERYLEHHAQRFVHQFDPNCYLYLSRSMDWFDLAEYADGDVMAGLASIRVEKSLSIGVHTDILFPLQQQEQVADGLRAGARRRNSSTCLPRRATTPSWSTSPASARRSPAS
jgi:homoserine O-acetyltransferase